MATPCETCGGENGGSLGPLDTKCYVCEQVEMLLDNYLAQGGEAAFTFVSQALRRHTVNQLEVRMLELIAERKSNIEIVRTLRDEGAVGYTIGACAELLRKHGRMPPL